MPSAMSVVCQPRATLPGILHHANTVIPGSNFPMLVTSWQNEHT